MALLLGASPVIADGFAIDKVYHPYVQPLEREFELRSLYLNDSSPALDGTQSYRLGLGRSFGERWFGEVYVIVGNEPGLDVEIDSYEIELKWQLTEQGEYFADWGLLFELEREQNDDIWEYGSTLLVEKELGRWATTLNLAAIYEWGSDIRNEWETEGSAQLRYRYRAVFEPALEFYAGELSTGIGPVALGDLRFGVRQRLHWELGVIFGLDSDSPDQTVRGLLEFEF